jgi:hypothetical protein
VINHVGRPTIIIPSSSSVSVPVSLFPFLGLESEPENDIASPLLLTPADPSSTAPLNGAAFSLMKDNDGLGRGDVSAMGVGASGGALSSDAFAGGGCAGGTLTEISRKVASI